MRTDGFRFPRAPARTGALVLALCLAYGCMGPPSQRTAKVSVPFIPQPPDRCGPVALAMVETFYGSAPDLDALVSYVQIPALSGTIPDLLAEAARRDGFTAEILTLTPMQIHAVLLAGKPPILLLGPDPDTPDDPRGHFLVATGYRPETRSIRVHTGTRKNVWIPSESWLPRYQSAGSTALLLAPASP